MRQSRMIKQAMAVAIALGLTGCAVKQAPSITQPTVTSKLGSAVKLSGTLRISIKWPTRNYNTALLPDSTNRVVLEVKKDDATIAQKVITREASQTTVSTSLVVQAGSGYSIEVSGYRDETLVAHGAASGVNIKAGAISNVPAIIMTALTVPAINSVANSDGLPVAKVGDTITLAGTNLGAEASLSLQVSLNGAAVPAGNITRVGTGSIQVVVPAGATCGTMSVKVDNVSAETSNPLWIVDSVALPATASVLNHSTYTLVPTIGWAVSGTDTAETFGTPPDPLYSLDAAFGTVTGNVFSPNSTSAGPVNVTPKMGSLIGSALAITILPSIDSVSLNAATGSVNATSEGTEPAASYPNTCSFSATVNGDAFNTGVTWSSSDAALATVDSNGVVTANNSGAPGSVTITATSKDDPSKFAQATVTITNDGDVVLGVH